MADCVLFFFNRIVLELFCYERHWTAEFEMQIERNWDGVIIFNHGTNLAQGVAIPSHSYLEHNIRETRRDHSGRILNILLDFQDHTFNIMNTYAPLTDVKRRGSFQQWNNSSLGSTKTLLEVILIAFLTSELINSGKPQR